jgi:hypothetical protein
MLTRGVAGTAHVTAPDVRVTVDQPPRPDPDQAVDVHVTLYEPDGTRRAAVVTTTDGQPATVAEAIVDAAFGAAASRGGDLVHALTARLGDPT